MNGLEKQEVYVQSQHNTLELPLWFSTDKFSVLYFFGYFLIYHGYLTQNYLFSVFQIQI